MVIFTLATNFTAKPINIRVLLEDVTFSSKLFLCQKQNLWTHWSSLYQSRIHSPPGEFARWTPSKESNESLLKPKSIYSRTKHSFYLIKNKYSLVRQ